MSTAFLCLGAAFARRGATAGLLLALVALIGLPVPAVLQDCTQHCAPPVFTDGLSTSRSLDETIGDAASTTRIDIGAPVTATDANENDAPPDFVVYEHLEDPEDDPGEYPDSESDAFLFEIDPITGQLRTNPGVVYDWEAKRSYKIRVVACDNASNRDRIDVTITLRNLQEKPLAPTVTSVTPASTTKLVVRWTAPTNTGRPPITSYDLQYRFCPGVNGNCDELEEDENWLPGRQNVTDTNAVISGLTAGKWYQVRVHATNSDGNGPWSGPRRGQTQSMDGPPVFLESSPTRRSFAENTPPGRNIGEPVKAEGEGTLTYSLENTDTVAAGRPVSFDIVASGGQIRTKSGENYDYEPYETRGIPYEVTVTATDPYGNSASITVKISLTDVDEPPLRPAAPVVSTASDASLSVSWTAPDNPGPPITDYDLRYRRLGTGERCADWCSWQYNDLASADTITGLESGKQYQVQVLARNDEGASDWSPSGIGWTNAEGNHPPMFSSTPDLRFDESMGNEPKPVMDIEGGQVTATDDDVTNPDKNDRLAYSLEGVDAASFTINSGTGQISTRRIVYDHEAKDSYSVTVKATDLSNVSDTIALTIRLNDVDEPPLAPRAPSVSGRSSKSLSVSWNPPDNTGRPDIKKYQLQYRGVCSDGQCPPDPGTDWVSPQDIIGTSAVISGLMEYTRYQVRVRAWNDESKEDDDNWSLPGSGRTLKPPTFADDSTTRSFRENTPAGQNIGAPVRATFAGDTLMYRLEGTDAGSFDIDSSTGQLKTKSGVTYDHETKSSYMVTVRANDPDNASDTIDVSITVTDVREPPLAPGTPEVSRQSDTSLSVSWMAPDNDGRPDIENYDVQYRQGTSGGWRNGPQDVDSTGDTMCPTNTICTTIEELDLNTQYQIQVRATNDEGNGPYSQPGFGGTGTGNPGNNSPTFDEDTSNTRSFPENTPPNRNIGAPVMATDQDAGDTLTYSLHGTDAASFNIDFGTGQLRTKPGVTYDYETKNVYTVMVRVTDSSNATASIDVTIHVTDVDENRQPPVGNRRPPRSPSDEDPSTDDKTPSISDVKPMFPSPSATRSFPENTPSGQNVGEPVTAKVVVGPLTYTLRGGDAASFDIDASTGQLKTKAGVTYDYEVKSSYAVTVRATGSTNVSANVAVTINVENVAEKPAAPDAPTVSAPDGSRTSLLATWMTPDVNGGPPITGYEVEYRQGTSGLWVPWPHGGTDTTTTITELSAGNDYQVRIRARNADGLSEWSPPGSGRTNGDAMNGWLARFGRSIAQQMMDGVGDRLASPCRTGLQGTVAGHGFGGEGSATSLWAGGGRESRPLLDSPLLVQGDSGSGTGPALLAGTEFELGSETAGGGIACVWGRGAYSSFHGGAGSYSLDGDVTTGTLGADYAMGAWTVGLALSHSRGEGRYGSREDVEAALTGFFPYAGYKVTERLSVWGLGGFGRGGLTLTPGSGRSMETDMGLLMVAAGARSLLLAAARGLNVAFETDGFWVHAASDAAPGLLASKEDANRLRFGLESFYTAALKAGGTLTPRLEIGWRYDGGSAETGLGVDIGGGLVWSAPAGGITAEIEVRRVLMHEATGFRDWSVSGLVRYDPNPSSERGALLALRSSIGTTSLDGANGLLEREARAGLAAANVSDGGQLSAEAAYGFSILGGRFTGVPWVGAGVLESGRDYRVGYRISRTGLSGSGMQVGIEGLRRENNGGDAEAEHAIGLRFALGW